jgi:hypothetical protein
MVAAPRATLTSVVAGGPGGIRDLLVLLALQVVAVQTPALWSAVLYLVRVSYASGISLLLNTIAESLVIPIVALLAAALIMGHLTRGSSRRERNLDLAALSMVPMVCIQLAASIGFACFGVRPWRWGAIALLASGATWFLALVRLSLRLVRGGNPGETP